MSRAWKLGRAVRETPFSGDDPRPTSVIARYRPRSRTGAQELARDLEPKARQQAERANGLELRVVVPVRDLLRQHVHYPEEDDAGHGDEDEETIAMKSASLSSSSGESSDADARDLPTSMTTRL